jgi:hypothetical protein
VKKKTSGCTLIITGFIAILVVATCAKNISNTQKPQQRNSTVDTPISTNAGDQKETKLETAIKEKYNTAKNTFEGTIEQQYNNLINSVAAGKESETAHLIHQFERFRHTDYKDVAKIITIARTKKYINRLEKLSEADSKGRAEIYGELAKLNPENADYLALEKKYAEAWKIELAAAKEQERKEAKERLAKAAEEERVQSRINLIAKQFSGWDGSHIELTRIIKDSMNDPKSYEHVETRYSDKGDYILVWTTFRGKNAFGGVVKNSVGAKFTLDGRLIEVISQGN